MPDISRTRMELSELVYVSYTDSDGEEIIDVIKDRLLGYGEMFTRADFDLHLKYRKGLQDKGYKNEKNSI